MEIYNLSIDLFKENLSGIQFNSKKNDPLAGVSVATKTSLTKLYNQKHKLSKSNPLNNKSMA